MENNFLQSFRSGELTTQLSKKLMTYDGPPIKIMEVCGTHTMAIHRFGIRSLLPRNIKLISGPGCPVCVTGSYFINAANLLAQQKDVIVTTFGDLMRVPGTDSSLSTQKAKGCDIRIVYSPLDAVEIAKQNPQSQVVFLGVGFETTIPVTSLAIIKAKKESVNNFSVLSANKTIHEALRVLAIDKNVKIDGFLYPGHVSAIIGMEIYKKVADEFSIPGVIAGFEPADILASLIFLADTIKNGENKVENLYPRVVTEEGNPLAVEKIYEVFEPCDDVWRGIGTIPMSGLSIRSQFEDYDAWKRFSLSRESTKEPVGCRCGDVLKGLIDPKECALFKKACTPENPVGACMVSSEGTCAAYYKYSDET